VSAADAHRRALIAGGIAAYGAVFCAFVLFEQPGLGIGHFFYVAIVLIAFATNAWWGALAGAVATGLYALAVLITPTLSAADVITIAAGIRLVTYVGVGVVVGVFVQTNRTLVGRLREQVERDFLTDLLNTRAFDDRLAARCQLGTEFLLVLGDMDNLKEINDAHGHDEGNRAIRRVAELLRENIDRADQLARIGGDEFAILTATSAEGIAELAQRLQRALAREGYEISFGWAAAPADGAVPLELFRKADDRLYAAKLLRRNRKTILRLATQESATG
jgi:diguanylate cyclase (GGDEF)-like protein